MNNTAEDIYKYIKETGVNYYGVSEVNAGVEKSYPIVGAPWATDVYSVSKLVTSAAVGLAWDEGKLDINAPIVKLIENCPEPAEPKWKEVTLHDCLRHKTGLINGNLDIDDPACENLEDWLTVILAMPLEGTRDVDYHYTDATFYLACRAVETAVNENVFSYVHRKLCRPLGFRESAWSMCPKGYTTGGSGFCANDRDLARLGYLWVNKGMYNGKRILSEEYIKLSLEKNYGIEKRNEYPEFYYKTGANGQIVIMLPEENRALVIRGYVPSEVRTELIDRFFTVK